MNDIKKLSIVVVAYNHLDYTKQCIESIMRFSNDVDYELIVVNNGSSDGTRDYFNTLEDVKIVDIRDNIGSAAGFNRGVKSSEGEYVLLVGNDLILTPNFASNLLKCIESDEKIGIVVPICNYSGNMQSITYNYTTMEELIEFAGNHNVSNPRLWEERLRLVTYVCIMKRALFEEIGGSDPYFEGGFDDDDMTFKIRRMGYSLILARDTFVYHYGSVTMSEFYNNTLYTNRDKFIKKYKVDSWGDLVVDQNVVNFVDYPEKMSDVNILGINPSCGGTILQIKNKFIEKGIKNVNLYAFTEEERFCTDLKTICSEAYFGKVAELDKYFIDKKFDYIIFQGPIEQNNSLDLFLENLKNKTQSGGKVLFSVKNMGFYQYVSQILTHKPLYNSSEIKFIDKDVLTKQLVDMGFIEIKIMTIIYYGYQNEMDFIANISKCFEEAQREVVKQNLQIYEYKFNISLE